MDGEAKGFAFCPGCGLVGGVVVDLVCPGCGLELLHGGRPSEHFVCEGVSGFRCSNCGEKVPRTLRREGKMPWEGKGQGDVIEVNGLEVQLD